MEEFHILVNTSRRSFEPVLSTSSQLYLFLNKEKLQLDFSGMALNNFDQQAENFGAVEVYGGFSSTFVTLWDTSVITS